MLAVSICIDMSWMIYVKMKQTQFLLQRKQCTTWIGQCSTSMGQMKCCCYGDGHLGENNGGIVLVVRVEVGHYVGGLRAPE